MDPAAITKQQQQQQQQQQRPLLVTSAANSKDNHSNSSINSGNYFINSTPTRTRSQISPSIQKDHALLRDAKYHQKRLAKIRKKKGYIIDMDGVIYHGTTLLPGAKELVEFLYRNNKRFLFLTNNSAPTPSELQQKLLRLGIQVTEDHFFTAGQATAEFLRTQMPEGGSCYVIGEPGLVYALYQKGFIMNDQNPDYVVLGEGKSYNYERLTKAVQLIDHGAKLVATNLDVDTLDSQGNKIPSCGAFAACVEAITKTKTFFCGKPSALMMRYAQRTLGLSTSETCIIGDRMDTDVAAGISSEIDAVLVLSGVSTMEDLAQFAFRPYVILNGVFEIPDDGGDNSSNGGGNSDNNNVALGKKSSRQIARL
ncbi:HAD-like domain-containing protein [Zychaea mexicana]|uniref:HAD-like domain-containing protein n=1 Tax=Zychaea mexicana TaxID=64656 RepID=UPI0022FE7DAB|nr:HAD-like domain-containing protein [Zychaea mexicana]KAI9493474.1 HAD-like domain-containing protein [Zychaea mexicana]